MQLGNANAVQNSTVSIGTANGLAFSAGIGTFNLGGLSGASDETLADAGSNAVTISVGANNADTTYTGILSGSGALTKVGNGTLALTGSNTFTGGLTVSAGTVTRNGGSSGSEFGAGNVTVNGGTLDTYGQPNLVINNGSSQESVGERYLISELFGWVGSSNGETPLVKPERSAPLKRESGITRFARPSALIPVPA